MYTKYIVSILVSKSFNNSQSGDLSILLPDREHLYKKNSSSYLQLNWYNTVFFFTEYIVDSKKIRVKLKL